MILILFKVVRIKVEAAVEWEQGDVAINNRVDEEKG